MHRIDMASYPRREHFAYFKSMGYPYVGLTVTVDVTRFLARIKAAGDPFFLSFLWCAAGAANAVPALRQRIDGDGIIEFERCPTSHTVAKPDGTYAYCALDCDKPFEAFLPYAKEEQERALTGGIEEDAQDALSYFFVSTIPWVSYTALVQPTPSPADSNPRITWGRYFSQGEQALMPVSLLCHHALADGRHIADFYAALDKALEQF